MENVYYVVSLVLLAVAGAASVGWALRNRSRVRDYEAKYAGLIDVHKAIAEARSEHERASSEAERQRQQVVQETEALRLAYREKRSVFDDLVRQAAIYDEEIELAELGFYKPHYDFDTSEDYKRQIDEVRGRQKSMISAKSAVTCSTEWAVDGSKAKGRTMTNRSIRLTSRAFNNECDAAISATRWNNADRMEARIEKAFAAINKLNQSNHIRIEYEYFRLKLSELRLTHEYREKRQEEKAHQAELRRLQREEAQLEKDAERARREEEKFQKLLDKARAQAESAIGEQLSSLQSQISGLEADLEAAHAVRERALSMAQQTRAGHVYVVSNVGSFGEDVFKIGMTRRLDPYDRVRELGDASVPFVFDVHAIVYSEDAPSLEGALHKRFQDRRVNMVNSRKEFFRASLDEIESCVREVAPSADFIRNVEARDYRESRAMRERDQAIGNGADPRSAFPDSI